MRKSVVRHLLILSIALVSIALVACAASPESSGTSSEQASSQASFTPSLDTATKCSLSVAGGYDNFEALEAEFDKFNEYYPDVELSYTKLDDYNNIVSTTLSTDDAPDIYFAFDFMQDGDQYNAVFEHAEDLSDPALGINLSCVRPSLLCKDEAGACPMAPIFASVSGILVNEDLFEKEGVSIPMTYDELLAACDTFNKAGYPTPILCYNEASAYGNLVGELMYSDAAKDPKMLEKLNALDPSAGEYMRPVLEKVSDMTKQGCFNLDVCNELEDGYNALILRFFEGDIPMALCSADTASGTAKRESQSEAFTAHPFTYSLHPLTLTNEGPCLLDKPSVQLAVNKDGENLDMANEFMRFLVSPQELNDIARAKRLITVTPDLAYDGVYAPFSTIDPSRIISTHEVGLSDDVTIQYRVAAYQVANGKASIDEAVAGFGTYAL
ncbi:MAG: carbohydrate ABC transporter substrate-binding protein [Atopobiaceae bacterium]|nr:carbohydrate ABC transporter substrate-binding protein [Atopobiaceae bacterium]